MISFFLILQRDVRCYESDKRVKQCRALSYVTNGLWPSRNSSSNEGIGNQTLQKPHMMLFALLSENPHPLIEWVRSYRAVNSLVHQDKGCLPQFEVANLCKCQTMGPLNTQLKAYTQTFAVWGLTRLYLLQLLGLDRWSPQNILIEIKDDKTLSRITLSPTTTSKLIQNSPTWTQRCADHPKSACFSRLLDNKK